MKIKQCVKSGDRAMSTEITVEASDADYLERIKLLMHMLKEEKTKKIDK